MIDVQYVDGNSFEKVNNQMNLSSHRLNIYLVCIIDQSSVYPRQQLHYIH